MRHRFSEMKQRARQRFLEGTSFSDDEGDVCTPACRRDALRRRAERSVFRAGATRY
jgi:hypothetical protein